MSRYTSQPPGGTRLDAEGTPQGNFAKIYVQYSLVRCLVLCEKRLRFKDQACADLSKGFDDVMFGDEAHNFRFVVDYGQAAHAFVD